MCPSSFCESQKAPVPSDRATTSVQSCLHWAKPGADLNTACWETSQNTLGFTLSQPLIAESSNHQPMRSEMCIKQQLQQVSIATKTQNPHTDIIFHKNESKLLPLPVLCNSASYVQKWSWRCSYCTEGIAPASQGTKDPRLVWANITSRARPLCPVCV